MKVSGWPCCRSSTREAIADLDALAEGLTDDSRHGHVAVFLSARHCAQLDGASTAERTADVRTAAPNSAPAT